MTQTHLTITLKKNHPVLSMLFFISKKQLETLNLESLPKTIHIYMYVKLLQKVGLILLQNFFLLSSKKSMRV